MGIQKPSQRFSYALRALVDLALHQGTGPVTVKAIAKRQKIPLRYLEQLFHRLRQHGLVMAERGPRGGYRLSRSPREISVSTIFQTLEQNGKTAPHVFSRSESDPTVTVWRQVEMAVKTTLQATTLEALVTQAREQNATVNHRFTFHI